MGNCTCVEDRGAIKSDELDNKKVPKQSSLASYYEENSSGINRDVRKIYEQVLNKGEVRSVQIIRKTLTESDCEALCRVIPMIKQVTDLTLIDNSLKLENLKDILGCVKMDKLEKLCIASNNLKNDGLNEISQHFDKMHNLRELDLNANKISSVDKLCRILPELSKLNSLNVRGNPINNRGLKKLARCLKGHIQMQEFKMDSIDLSQDDVAEIRAILPLAALV